MQTQPLHEIESLLDLAESRGLDAIPNSDASIIFQRMRAVFAKLSADTKTVHVLQSWAQLTPANKYALRRVRNIVDEGEPRFFTHHGVHFDLAEFIFAKPGCKSQAVGNIVVVRLADNAVQVFPAQAGDRPNQQVLL